MTKNNWLAEYGPVPEVRTVHEQDKPEPVVIYDHHGMPLCRARQEMGFDLSGKK